MDFSQDELIESVERLVAGLLERAGVGEPPVDAIRVAEEHLGIPVVFAEPEEDERGRPRASTRRPDGGIVISTLASEEQQQAVAAQGIARGLLPDLLRRFGAEGGLENKQAAAYLRNLFVSRFLIPTKLLRSALRTCKYDVAALKRHFRTASMEAIAHRFLDLDSPCVVAIVDDGVVASRRGNMAQVTKKLTAAEQACWEHVSSQEAPDRLRLEGWTVHGWPVPHRPFQRVLLYAAPDDV